MSLVWRKIQRSSKKPFKFRFTAVFQELSVQCTNKWQPYKLAIAWVHRRRRHVTKEHKWEPSITDPYHGLIIWPTGASETLEIVTTMYKDLRHEAFDDKEWTFIVEEITSSGRRKPVAGLDLNMRLFIEQNGAGAELRLRLAALREELIECRLHLCLHCQALGSADDQIDDDARSLASQMSSVAGEEVAVSRPLNGFVNKTAQNGLEVQSSLESFDRLVAQAGEEIKRSLDKLDEEVKTIASKTPPKAVIDPKTPGISNSSDQKPSSSSAEKSKLCGESHKSEAISQKPVKSPTIVSEASTDLMSWCKNVTKTHQHVRLNDFSMSWRNGMAFCAIVHHFRPDLIDYDSLDPANIYKNCSLAFDAAHTLGVTKIISPNDMVVLAIPDKIAVMTYVSLLRDTFTGQHLTHSVRLSGIWTSSAPGKLAHSVPDASKTDGHLFDRLPKPEGEVVKPELMTRNQLMNPFDSDDDALERRAENEPDNVFKDNVPESNKTDETNTSKRLTANLMDSSTTTPMKSPSLTVPVLSTKTMKLLEQYEKSSSTINNDVVAVEEDDSRRQALKERARKMIEEAKMGNLPSNSAPKTIKMTDFVKPANQIDLKSTYTEIKTNIDATGSIKKQPQPGSSISAPATRQRTPDTSSSSFSGDAVLAGSESTGIRRAYLASKANFNSSLSTVENFKRFGSMRRQELAKHVQLLSNRVSQTVRSQSTPKEIGNLPTTVAPIANRPPHFKSPVTSPTTLTPGDGFSALENGRRSSLSSLGLLSREELDRQMDILSQKQQELDKKATQVERLWRQIMQDESGSEREQATMNEYLALLNQRNMLTRQEMHLSLARNIDDHELQFRDIQRQLGELIQIDESEKTESHKQKIDALMERLIVVVNTRDQLLQQMISEEQETEQDAQLASDVMSQSLLVSHAATGQPIDKDTCSIQ